MIGRFIDLAQSGLLFLDPERAHELTLRALERGVFPRGQADDPRLAQALWGLKFPNPLGMAAGFDKDARVPGALLAMGFGFTEIGTVTPRPQKGNPRPRVFRLIRERGVINRLGFNSGGHAAAMARLATRPAGVVGVNIGANKDSAEPIEDFAAGLAVFYSAADYFTVNISSPNTPGLRDLQAPDRLDALLTRLMRERETLTAGKPRRPILVKLAPDIHDDDLPPVVACLMAHRVDGIILTNTTISRAEIPRASYRAEAGGLSGRPLFQRATRVLAKVHLLTEGRVPLIGVGGVDSGEAALAKIRAGASLVQLYTGMIYEGGGLIGGIKQRLIAAMEQAGAASLDPLRGQDAERWAALEL
ncbi:MULTISPECIES: quinone-dependent dihydroorotate dehydrogenase [Rhodomicrobium]|uniref:quinone-dependent dihydroorotate dehydrogenase n=1 Tax=Rhodomicrobium TaxID=1068 RepID=UPI000B4BA350|nr:MULTISPECIES: quinone-dependent dihydroorotate dehydrogenase [Rhodomicrobium]